MTQAGCGIRCRAWTTDRGPRISPDPSARHGTAAPRGSDVMGDMGGMEMSMLDPHNAPQVKLGPGVQMIAPMPDRPDRRAGHGPGERRPPGAGLHRPRGAGAQSGHTRPVARHGDPPDRQHGTVHVGVRRRKLQREAADPTASRRRAGADHPGQRHHDDPPDPPARPLLRAGPWAGGTHAAKAHGQRHARAER